MPVRFLNLLMCGARAAAIVGENAFSTAAVTCSEAPNWRVTGSMNDSIKAAEWCSGEIGPSPQDVGRHLNNTPMAYIRLDSMHEEPRLIFLRLHKRLSGEDNCEAER